MGADKIAAFYDDPVKRAYDAHSAEKAFHLRALTVEPGLAWAARRGVALCGAARDRDGARRCARGGSRGTSLLFRAKVAAARRSTVP